MGQYKLFQEIISRSKSNEWEEAKKEWKFNDVYESDEPLTCLCGHFPIMQVCVLQNVINQNEVEVGNECVKKFFNIKQADSIIKSIREIKSDITKSVNVKTLDFFRKKGCIDGWKYDFYNNIIRKSPKSLSEKQLDKKREINNKMIESFKIINNKLEI